MPNILPFPELRGAPSSEPCEITEMIREELNHLSSNEFMINTILERMGVFIEALDFDLEVNMELDDEGKVASVIPHIQSLQHRFDSVISDVISERILHEIHVYHIERANSLSS